MRAHPPSGLELSLHPDASALADLWAHMLLHRLDNVPAVEISYKTMVAFERWSAESAGADQALTTSTA